MHVYYWERIDMVLFMKILLFSFFENYKNKQLLKKIPLFKDLRKKELNALCDVIEKAIFNTNDIIIREGDIGDFFYIIKQGSVKVLTKDNHQTTIDLAKLDAGAYFGEQALLNSVPVQRNASVMALTKVEVLKISHRHFQKVLNSHEDIKHLLELFGKREFYQKITRQFSLLQFLPEDLTDKLEGKIVSFENNAVIFHQGDPVDNVYWILSGAVHIEIIKDNNMQTTELFTGEIFGELGVLENNPRAGTAIAKGLIKLLAIPAKIFQKLYVSSSQLQKSIKAQQKLYKIPQKGTVIIHRSILLNIPAVSIEYQLLDKRIIYAAHAFDKTIFTMQDKANLPERIIFFQKGETIKKEIGILNGRIVSLFVLGQWDEVGYVCNLILDAVPIEDWQINLFENTGSLGTERFQYKNNNENICYCMSITYKEIEQFIQKGDTNLDVLLKDTGAATVCGGCRPRISEMLGNVAWSFVAINQCNQLNPNVRYYQLKPRNNILYPYQAGQHIVLSALIKNKWVQRSYTLTSVYGESNFYEIAIKKEEGYFTRWLFEENNKELIIKTSPPQGDFTLDLNKHTPAVFFAAGIGITPAYAFARALKNQNSKRPFFIHYSERTDFIFVEELKKIAENCPNFALKMHVTLENARLKEEDISELIIQSKNADFYICGPRAYQDLIIKALKKLKIPNHLIHIEIFKFM